VEDLARHALELATPVARPSGGMIYNHQMIYNQTKEACQ